jgi:hypothetical protein
MEEVKSLLGLMAAGTVLGLGLALVVLPGVALLVVPTGVAILAVEFAWARRWLRKARDFVQGSRGSDVDGSRATARLSVPGKLRQRAQVIVSSATFVVAAALLVLAGAVLVAVPAALGILSLESGRAKLLLRNAKHSLLRANPLPEKDLG